jgi:tetratricopeptide (TPR) repeat protein
VIVGARKHGARVRHEGARAAVALVALLACPAVAAAQQGLTGAPQLARVYSTILDAHFEEVPDLLADACGPAPAEACQLLGVVSTWWEIQIDPHNRTHDRTFRVQADAAIAVVEEWTLREPERAEAWFYLGGAYGARAQWLSLRGERLAAARDGKRIKEALERALVLDPSLQDAHVGIGLYHYYAAVAPAAARMLRWLLFLPGGDRAAGLQEVLKTRNAGLLLRDEADYQLHVMYLWHEKQPEQALELLRLLDERHPTNPHFLQLIAEVQDYRLKDFTGSLRTYQELLQRALDGRVAHPALAQIHARLGIARLSLPEDALPHLSLIIDARPAAPHGAIAQAYLQLGEMLDRLGRVAEATDAYRAATTEAPDGDPLKTAHAARRALRER